MTKSKWSFDWVFRRVVLKVPLLGKPVANYYKTHGWFQRFVKFGFTGTIIYWLIRAPMIWYFTECLKLSFLFIPSYLVGAFITGLILTAIWFALSELWVWGGGEN